MFYPSKNNSYSHYIVNIAFFCYRFWQDMYINRNILRFQRWKGWGDSCFWCCKISFSVYLSVGIGKLWNRLSLWKRFASQNIGRSLRLWIGQNSMTWNKITGWQSCRQPFGLGKQVARQTDSIPNSIYCGRRSNDRSSDAGSLLEIYRNLEFCKSLNPGLNIYPIPGWYGRLFWSVGKEWWTCLSSCFRSTTFKFLGQIGKICAILIQKSDF